MGSNERIGPSFEPLDDGTGFEVVDPIERRRLALRDGTIDGLVSGGVDPFDLPTDAVASFDAERIRLDEASNSSIVFRSPS